jgi:competence protein ComEA
VPSLTLTRRQALAVAALALAAVFAAAHFLGSSSASDSTSYAAGSTTSSASTPSTSSEDDDAAPEGSASFGATGAGTSGSAGVPAIVVVDVAGAVRRPGVYRLPQGSRITDAIARAGGMSAHAEAASVDLAAPLADGEQVLVPASVAGAGAVAAAPAGSSAGPSASAPVDLNTATAAQLDALPGVGPVTAQKIVDYRQQHGPYTSVDDLDAISGIGPAKIANLKGLVIA